MTRPNRNELCPCGSGRKHKKCCGVAQSNTSLSRGVLLALAPVAVLAALGIYAAISGPAEQEAAAAPATATEAAPAATPVKAASSAPAPSQPGTASPAAPAAQPGTAPPGKVWSPEHGHWHDARPAGGQSPVQIDVNMANPAIKMENGGIRVDGKALAAAAEQMRRPGQPPGPAPAGKVWSTEHKHWHDMPKAPMETIHLGTVNRPSKPVPPPGPAPAGKVWSPEHGHWHDAPAAPAPATTTTQP